jgi:hypothetical protein
LRKDYSRRGEKNVMAGWNGVERKLAGQRRLGCDRFHLSGLQFERFEVSILKEKKNGDDERDSTWKLWISRESEEAV